MPLKKNMISVWLTVTVVLVSTVSNVAPLSKRMIYTLFTQEKTWNEAHDICESQFGQLLKVTDGQEAELVYLDTHVFSGAVTQAMNTGQGMWTGSHDPNNTGNYVCQDCHTFTQPVTSGTGRCVYSNSWVNTVTNCNNMHMFICQRYEGDCWFEPFQDETIDSSQESSFTLLTSVEATDCAFQCRNNSMSGAECWAFTYDSINRGCRLHFLDTSDAAGTAPSVMYLDSSRPAADDTILYLRRCFEGSLDTGSYPDFVDTSADPDSVCSLRGPVSDPGADDICYCTATQQPPIPEPISTADKVEEIIKELTIDTSNTSASIRKKTSAQDHRPSAQGVGYFGIAMMAGVFGGLVLLDMNVILQALKKLTSVFRPNANLVATD